MMSSSVTLLVEEEGVDVDRAEGVGGTATPERLTTFNGISIYSTHDRKRVERGKTNLKMA